MCTYNELVHLLNSTNGNGQSVINPEIVLYPKFDKNVYNIINYSYY